MEEIKVGEFVSAIVTGFTKYGIFLKVNEEYTGMIHISQLTGKFVDDVRRLYVIGEEVEAKVLEIDEEKKQVKLSTKEIHSNKNARKSIKEEGRGFAPLKENLGTWIEEKLSELEKNAKSE